jgi:hypothetical protein
MCCLLLLFVYPENNDVRIGRRKIPSVYLTRHETDIFLSTDVVICRVYLSICLSCCCRLHAMDASQDLLPTQIQTYVHLPKGSSLFFVSWFFAVCSRNRQTMRLHMYAYQIEHLDDLSVQTSIETCIFIIFLLSYLTVKHILLCVGKSDMRGEQTSRENDRSERHRYVPSIDNMIVNEQSFINHTNGLSSSFLFHYVSFSLSLFSMLVHTHGIRIVISSDDDDDDDDAYSSSASSGLRQHRMHLCSVVRKKEERQRKECDDERWRERRQRLEKRLTSTLVLFKI